MTPNEILDAIKQHNIALTPALGLWCASVELGGKARRAMKTLHGIGSTPQSAVALVYEKLKNELSVRQAKLFEDAA